MMIELTCYQRIIGRNWFSLIDDIYTLIPSAIVLSFAIMYTMSCILNISLKEAGLGKCLIVFLSLSSYLVTSYYFFTNNLIRYLFFILIITLIFILVYKKSFQSVFISAFFTWILIVISELIFALLVSVILKIEISEFYGVLIGNIGVSCILVTIIKIRFIYEIVQKCLNKIIKSKKCYSIFLIITLALATSIILYINYFELAATIRLLLSLSIIIIYTAITIILFNEKNNSCKIHYEYETILKNLEEYEKMLDYQKVANHENKNQLLVIKGMINKKDPKINDYIDSIISEKVEDNEDLLYKTNIIPSGGLKGLVYYKILSMKEKNIEVSLNISLKVRKINFEKLGINLNKDLCKIMGVILDNSIQAVQDLDTKKISIDMNYCDNNFTISVSNNFRGNLDLSKIDDMGYTTKGDGHGYGLSLVKKIIGENENLENKREINSNVFTQKIIVKVNKNKKE